MPGEIVDRLKRACRIMLYDRDSRFFEDEKIAFNLKRLTPVPDQTSPEDRLNVITPSLSASAAFGGLSTLIKLPLQVFQHGLVDQGWHLRFICLEGAPPPDDNIALQFADQLGVPPSRFSMHYGSGAGEPVPVGPGDRFLGSLWHSHYATMSLMQFQHEHFGGAKVPYLSLVQDYEAGFHPWSSAYMLAQASYEDDWPKRLIFNSEELASYYFARGHQGEASRTFQPVMNATLRAALNLEEQAAKERRILFYGRPDDRRNCFFLGRRALEIWAERYAGAAAWRVVSVGADYPAFQLANQVPVDVLGKLTLEGYAEELNRAALGLSLMASPHPSYPPLEMAHFGALTICNNFECKDLRLWHENLLPVDHAEPEDIADALTHACEAFENNPTIGLAGRSLKPGYLEEMADETLEGIAALIAR